VFGRAGEGPGEFRNVANIGWLGDTLWVSEHSRRRLTLISPRGTLLRVGESGPVEAKDTMRFVARSLHHLVGLYADKSRLYELTVPIIKAEQTSRDLPLQYARTSDQGQLMSIPISIERPNRYIWGNSERDGNLPIPFRAQTVSSVSPEGSRIVSVVTRIARGQSTSTYTVTVQSPTGNVVWSRDIAFTGERIARSTIDSVVGLADDICGRSPICPVYRSRLRDSLPSVYAPVRRVIAGRDGSVWIELRSTSAGRPWVVLSSSGAMVGTAIFSMNTRLMVVQQDRVWASVADQDGVESLLRFGVRP
jgi:hypothetical protein